MIIKMHHTELEGSTDGMQWVSIGDKEGLFKPGSSETEKCYYALSEYFDVPVCPTIDCEFEGVKGFVSVSLENKRFKYVHIADYYEQKTGRVYTSNLNSIKEILTPYTLEILYNQMFLDAVMNQGDRHGGNIKVVLGLDKSLISIYPMYDNCSALKSNIGDYTILQYNENCITHYDNLKMLYDSQLCKDLFEKYKNVEFDNIVSKFTFGDYLIERKNKYLNKLINNK